MGIPTETTITGLVVFAQGILSFFSPCVLPLLPLYIGYLSGGGTRQEQDGTVVYDRGRTMRNTVFFVIGIGFAFLVLGLGMSAVGVFFRTSQMQFVRIGGALILFFGLYQVGVFSRISPIEKERRLPLRTESLPMSPVTALLMGFVFSFSWTPCVGPTLSGVLLLTATAQSRVTGMLLIGLYTLGFVLPFLAVGLFTTSLLNLFRRHRHVVKYTVKIGGILMILIGIMMITGKMNAVSGYLSSISGTQAGAEAAEQTAGDAEESIAADAEEDAAAKTGETESEAERALYPAPDFTLYDQYGKKHTLEEYRGKFIFLNFWATWCPPCRGEMPDIQALYEENSLVEDSDLVILGVAFPGYNQEKDEEGIATFLYENGYSYPTLMDRGADLLYSYGISAYPTTYMIDRDGNLFGYVVGAITKDTMENIIGQTREGRKK